MEEMSPHIRVAPITDPTNPAYRAKGHVDGRAEMCVTRNDLAIGTCVGCYPGSGRQWLKEKTAEGTFDAFEDGYCITLRDQRGYITPTQADPNPLSRCNDFRTNIVDPEGPQGRVANVNFVEIWQYGLPYAVFFTLCDTKKGEELLWDYGAGYWADAGMRKFRCLPLQEQVNGWNNFMDDFAATIVAQEMNAMMCSEAARVMIGGIVWVFLMMTKRETLAAVWISAGALAYGIVLVRKHSNH